MQYSGGRRIQDQQDKLEAQIIEWMHQDDLRMDALQIAAKLKLKDWCLAAGFVRTLIWDKLHGYDVATPLDDFDLIYFDGSDLSEETDRDIEKHLRKMSDYPWSVKNQARMHLKNGDQPYKSSADAMTYWVEEQAAIGARLNNDEVVEIIAPFGLEIFFDYSIIMNLKRPKPKAFEARVSGKKWLSKWPKLRIVG